MEIAVTTLGINGMNWLMWIEVREGLGGHLFIHQIISVGGRFNQLLHGNLIRVLQGLL